MGHLRYLTFSTLLKYSYGSAGEVRSLLHVPFRNMKIRISHSVCNFCIAPINLITVTAIIFGQILNLYMLLKKYICL